jgi:hypothetical protein
MATRTVNQIEGTAHHEAGHALACLSFGIAFDYVTIIGTDDSNGHLSRPEPGWYKTDLFDDRHLLDIRNEIAQGFAGQIAEWKYRGKRPRFGMQDDNQKAFDLALKLTGGGKTTGAFLEYCWCCAEDFVNSNWSKIQLVAAELAKGKTLSSRQLIEVTGEPKPRLLFGGAGGGLESPK